MLWRTFHSDLCNAARLRDIRQVPDEPRRPLSTIVPSNTDSSTTSTDWDSSGTPVTSQGNNYHLLLVSEQDTFWLFTIIQNKGHEWRKQSQTFIFVQGNFSWVTIGLPYTLTGFQCSMTYTKERPSLNVVLTVLYWPFEELVKPLRCFFLQKCHSIIWNSLQFLHWVRVESIKPQVKKKQEACYTRQRFCWGNSCCPAMPSACIMNELKSQHCKLKTAICYLFLLLLEFC